jgi:hypothetical protein
MKHALAASLAVLALCLGVYLLAEGVYSVVLWKNMSGSLAYKVYDRFADASVELPPAKAPPSARIATRKMVEDLVPQFVESGVAIGDVPAEGVYKTKLGDLTLTAKTDQGCLVLKPNLHKVMVQIRSDSYKLFGPPTLFYNDDAKLTDDVRAFLDIYGRRRSKLTSNALGERKTVPEVESARKVIVVGDSIAVGTNIADEDTIASQLQRSDPTRQYITIASPGTGARDNICNLEAASKRYHGEIDGLIYVYSPTDFNDTDEYGQPGAVLKWMDGFTKRENVQNVAVVLGANLLVIAPQFMRSFKERRDNQKEALALEQGAVAAGYRFVSIADLALDEADKRKTELGAFSLFMDGWGHMSPYGTALLVEKIALPPADDRIVVRATESR